MVFNIRTTKRNGEVSPNPSNRTKNIQFVRSALELFFCSEFYGKRAPQKCVGLRPPHRIERRGTTTRSAPARATKPAPPRAPRAGNSSAIPRAPTSGASHLLQAPTPAGRGGREAPQRLQKQSFMTTISAHSAACYSLALQQCSSSQSSGTTVVAGSQGVRLWGV